MNSTALLVGNSDGIGLATTQAWLKKEWHVIGISRSNSPIKDPSYQHITVKVQKDEYWDILKSTLEKVEHLDLCIYCAGIGERLDISDMDDEAHIVEVNLLGMVKTTSLVIPAMVKRGKGHFIGLSSFADELLSGEAPSYHASKAGFSNYLESLSIATKPMGVQVTNVRFGFVDTKMAKGDVKPFMMSIEKAIDHLQTCIEKKPMCYTAPRIAIPLVKFRKLIMKLGGK